MNMKFLGWFLGGMCLLGSLFTGCSDDDKEVGPQTGLDVELKVDKSIVQFVDNEASKDTIQITSNVHWTAKSSAKWCRLSQEEGDGNASVLLSVSANMSMSSRTAEILISAGGNNRDTVQVIQFGEGVEFVMYVDGSRVVGDTISLPFNLMQANMTIMSNVSFTFAQQDAQDWLLVAARNDEGLALTYSKDYIIQMRDNAGAARLGHLIFQQDAGKYTADVVIRQQEFTPGIYVDPNPVLGSHFKVAEFLITSMGVDDWEYRFIDPKTGTETGAPAWLSNFRKVKCTEFINHVGQRYYLRADCEYNTSNTQRSCTMEISYKDEGKQRTSRMDIVQLPYNGQASDSIVLLNIAMKNAVEAYGLMCNWSLSAPVTNWEKVYWTETSEGSRVNRLILGEVWAAYDMTACLGNLSELTELYLAKNFMTGPVPEELAYCKKLKVLQLFDNFNQTVGFSPSGESSGITACPSKIFKECTELTRVNLSNNLISEFPEDIVHAVNLEELDLSYNDFKDDLNALDWSGMTKLESISLFGLRKYQGDFFRFIFQIPSLKNIEFGRVNFNKSQLPEGWGVLSQLEILRMNTCNLTGSLPLSLAECSELSDLQVGNGDEYETIPGNALSGTLPAVYGEKLLKLQIFSISGNNIEGGIPASYANWLDVFLRTGKNFNVMSLQGNRLSGEIPEAIINHDAWTGKKGEHLNPLTGKTEACKLGDLTPETFICPQQKGYGFTNCQK